MFNRNRNRGLFFANAVFAFAVLCFVAAAADAALNRWLVVEQIRIVGGEDAGRAAAETVLRPASGKGLLTVDLFALKRNLENLPGVARAELSRDLPNVLRVTIEAPRPLARWDGGGLVDIYGKRYDGVAAAELPMFKGREENLQNIVELYDDAAKILQDDEIAQLELADGGGWRVFLQNKLVLVVGRDEPRRRLALYARYAKVLRKKFPQIRAVDLRYERGFAVALAKQKKEGGSEQ